MQSKIHHFIFPLNIFSQFLVDFHGCSELLCKNLAQSRLLNLNPERRVIFLFVLLLQKLVEVYEVDYFYFGNTLVEEVHEMTAFQNTAIRSCESVIKYLL